jgi:hypothetical protein
MAHARLSPSSAERWMTCPGSVKLTEGIEDKGSSYAAEGTAAHEMAERILKGESGQSLVGKKAENGIEFTQDMLDDVLHYTNVIQALAQQNDAALFIEVKLPLTAWTGELNDKGEPAKGTSDAVLVIGDELIVADLKFGMGVAVSAEENRQLMIYALAALDEFDLVYGPFKTVRLIISQPRMRSLSEWTISVEDLLAFGEQVKAAARACDEPDAPLVPSEKGCKFCRAKATCPALRAEVFDSIGIAPGSADDFADMTTIDMPSASTDADWLGATLAKMSLIETWCKAVRAEAERRLLAGERVPGFKLVQGRQGNRKWGEPTDVEAMLKHFRLKTEEMYDLSLISPTTAEKLTQPKLNEQGEKLPPVIGPRQWKKLQEHITRAEGQPSVAPESDKRPALVLSDAQDMSDLL